MDDWKSNLEEFADEPNTAVKISGICVPNKKWTLHLNKEIILNTIKIFGFERCMFASNFPVDSVLASFDEIFDGFKDVTAEMNNNETTHLFYQNAVKYYNPA